MASDGHGEYDHTPAMHDYVFIADLREHVNASLVPHHISFLFSYLWKENK